MPLIRRVSYAYQHPRTRMNRDVFTSKSSSFALICVWLTDTRTSLFPHAYYTRIACVLVTGLHTMPLHTRMAHSHTRMARRAPDSATSSHGRINNFFQNQFLHNASPAIPIHNIQTTQHTLISSIKQTIFLHQIIHLQFPNFIPHDSNWKISTLNHYP